MLLLRNYIVFFLLFSGSFNSQIINSNKFSTKPFPILTFESLSNCEYSLSDVTKVKLKNGLYHFRISETIVIEAWIYKHISCEINGDNLIDAIVVLEFQEGGSGRWQSVFPVINKNGIPLTLRPFDLGDREDVQKIYKKNNKIYLEVLVHYWEDKMCCPSKKETWKLMFKAESFVLLQ